MAALRLTQAFYLLYIMVSVPTLANCARVQRGATKTQAQQSQRTETDVHGHKWCNPFSYNTVKRYHFDVQLSDKNCTDGACVAIELVRDAEKPRLVLHGGKQWTVHKIPEPTTEGPTTVEASTAAPTTTAVSMLQGAPIGFHQTQAPTVAAYPVKAELEDEAEPGTLQWDLYSPGPSKTPDKYEIDLLDVNVISFFAGDLENPPKLEIIITDDKTDGNYHSRNVFELEGGLYYNEKFLQQSYDDVKAVELEKLQKSASESGTIASSTRNGAYLGLLPGALAGGKYAAFSIISFNGLASGWFTVGLVVAGPIVGAITGGIVGTAASLAMIMGGYETVKGYTIQPASSKVFEKLRCMSGFKACSDHVLVPKNKPCPRH